MLLIPEKIAVASLVTYGLYGPTLVNYSFLFFLGALIFFVIIEVAGFKTRSSLKYDKAYDENFPPKSLVVIDTLSKINKILLFGSIATIILLVGYCHEGIAAAVTSQDLIFYEPILNDEACYLVQNDDFSSLELAEIVYGDSGYGLLLMCAGIITTSVSLYIHLSNIFYDNGRVIVIQQKEDDITKIILGLPLACVAGSGVACVLFIGYAIYVANNILC